MPIKQGGIFASRVYTWPCELVGRSAIAPRPSRPTTWNEFLPISMPITAIAALSFSDMACSLCWSPPCQHHSLAGQEHGRTIPLADIDADQVNVTQSLEPPSTAMISPVIQWASSPPRNH